MQTTMTIRLYPKSSDSTIYALWRRLAVKRSQLRQSFFDGLRQMLCKIILSRIGFLRFA
uniref:Uncharacterized protein n=1 Tax=Syphacia muris TaxID=451379 RepID=A0A0N5AD82_9BILA